MINSFINRILFFESRVPYKGVLVKKINDNNIILNYYYNYTIYFFDNNFLRTVLQ